MRIKTRYADPRGSRITAQFVDGKNNGRQITVPFNVDRDDPHLHAVEALIEKFGVDTDGMEYFNDDAKGRRVYLQGTEISDIEMGLVPLSAMYPGAEDVHPWYRDDGPYGPPPAEL